MTESKPPGYSSRAMRADLEEADNFFKRITKSAGLSVLVTVGLLALFAAVIVRQHFSGLTTIIMDRIVVPKTQPKMPTTTPKPLPQRVQPVHHQIVPTKPLPHQAAVRPPRPVPHTPQPQGAHNHVLSTPGPGNGPRVLAGGNAQAGVPLDDQNAGNATANPTGTPAPPGPTPAPTPLPVPTATPMPVPTATPMPVPTPAPAPTATPLPAPVSVPGPSSAAAVESRVDPEIPDDLRGSQYTVRVRVRVTIGADGSATPTLRTSSGNPELDALALGALRKWKWKPALRDGSPVESTQYFQFVFEVD